MSSQFTIEETWMEHEGGTKFYHPVRIMHMSAKGTRVVTAIHFAGFKGNFERFRRPVNGGQVNINDIDIYQRQIDAKRKSGYATYEGLTPNRFTSESDFRAEVIRMFGRNDADAIFAYLGLMAGDQFNVQEETEEQLRPKTPAEDTSISFEDRPAAWGSW